MWGIVLFVSLPVLFFSSARLPRLACSVWEARRPSHLLYTSPIKALSMFSFSCAAQMIQSHFSPACFNGSMNSPSHHAIFLTTSLLLLALLPSISCHSKPLPSPQGMPMEVDKFRLGSTPPSCHNRCHQCSPCTAVQVPTLPAPRKAHPSSRGDPSAYGSQYSNYKPLGWKCCCGDRLYNP